MMNSEVEMIRLNGIAYRLESNGGEIEIYLGNTPVGTLRRYNRLSDLVRLPWFEQEVTGSIVRRMSEDVFAVGDREFRLLQVGADIFPPKTLVFDGQTEEYVGEFPGIIEPSHDFRKNLINAVYGRN